MYQISYRPQRETRYNALGSRFKRVRVSPVEVSA